MLRDIDSTLQAYIIYMTVQNQEYRINAKYQMCVSQCIALCN